MDEEQYDRVKEFVKEVKAKRYPSAGLTDFCNNLGITAPADQDSIAARISAEPDLNCVIRILDDSYYLVEFN